VAIFLPANAVDRIPILNWAISIRLESSVLEIRVDAVPAAAGVDQAARPKQVYAQQQEPVTLRR
jgi:hypothetical protein